MATAAEEAQDTGKEGAHASESESGWQAEIQENPLLISLAGGLADRKTPEDAAPESSPPSEPEKTSAPPDDPWERFLGTLSGKGRTAAEKYHREHPEFSPDDYVVRYEELRSTVGKQGQKLGELRQQLSEMSRRQEQDTSQRAQQSDRDRLVIQATRQYRDLGYDEESARREAEVYVDRELEKAEETRQIRERQNRLEQSLQMQTLCMELAMDSPGFGTSRWNAEHAEEIEAIVTRHSHLVELAQRDPIMATREFHRLWSESFGQRNGHHESESPKTVRVDLRAEDAKAASRGAEMAPVRSVSTESRANRPASGEIPADVDGRPVSRSIERGWTPSMATLFNNDYAAYVRHARKIGGV